MSDKHEIGIVGLGRMGFRMSENLRDKGYRVVGFDIARKNTARFKRVSMTAASSLEELCKDLKNRRIVVFLLPAGKTVDDSINKLLPFLEKDDVLIDCGNSYYKDSVRRSVNLGKYKIDFMDVGVSGGVKGARNGACLTVGGERGLFKGLEYLFKDMSAEDGYFYAGPTGWGHLTKTIHNGIEYGFLQAIGEGLNLVKTVADKEKVSIDLAKLCRVWCNGSIIESRLLSDTVDALRILKKDRSVSGRIGGGETGAWAQKIAKEYGAAVPVVNAALRSRKASQNNHDFSNKIIAAIRNVFGEHELFTQGLRD